MRKIGVKRNSLLYRIYLWYVGVEYIKPSVSYFKVLATVLFRAPIVWVLESGVRVKCCLVRTFVILQILGLVLFYVLTKSKPDLGLLFYLISGILVTALIYAVLTEDHKGEPLRYRVLLATVMPLIGLVLIIFIGIYGIIDDDKFKEFTNETAKKWKRAGLVVKIKKGVKNIGTCITEKTSHEMEIID